MASYVPSTGKTPWEYEKENYEVTPQEIHNLILVRKIFITDNKCT